METPVTRTGCCVVGGGPAGLVLGLILARAGIRTTVLEKHADFSATFAATRVHASTLALLDELGRGSSSAHLPPALGGEDQRPARTPARLASRI